MRACSTKSLRSFGILESAHLVLFPWSLLSSISDWFSDTLFTSVMHSVTICRFPDWGGRYAWALDLLLTLALYIRFVLAVQIARVWLDQQAHKPYHYFHLIKIWIIRPRNWTALTRNTVRHILFCEVYRRVTYRSYDQISKRLWRMNREVATRTVFRAEIGTRRCSKYLLSVSMCYLRHLDSIPRKWLFSRQLPFNI